jgi:hypothetical protein
MFSLICVNVCSLHWITTTSITKRLQQEQQVIKTSLRHKWRETCGWTRRKTALPLILFYTGQYRTSQSSLSYFGGNVPPHWRDSPLLDQGLSIIELSRSYSDTLHSVGFLWTSDQPDAGTSNCQHTTLSRDRLPWFRQDSKPQSQ